MQRNIFFFAKFTFSAKMRHVEKSFFRIYHIKKERSELDFRCELSRKGENDTLTDVIYRYLESPLGIKL